MCAIILCSSCHRLAGAFRADGNGIELGGCVIIVNWSPVLRPCRYIRQVNATIVDIEGEVGIGGEENQAMMILMRFRVHTHICQRAESIGATIEVNTSEKHQRGIGRMDTYKHAVTRLRVNTCEAGFPDLSDDGTSVSPHAS